MSHLSSWMIQIWCQYISSFNLDLDSLYFSRVGQRSQFGLIWSDDQCVWNRTEMRTAAGGVKRVLICEASWLSWPAVACVSLNQCERGAKAEYVLHLSVKKKASFVPEIICCSAARGNTSVAAAGLVLFVTTSILMKDYETFLVFRTARIINPMSKTVAFDSEVCVT